MIGTVDVSSNFRSLMSQMPVDAVPFLSTASYGIALSSASCLSLFRIRAASSPRATPPNLTGEEPIDRSTYKRKCSGISQSPIFSLKSLKRSPTDLAYYFPVPVDAVDQVIWWFLGTIRGQSAMVRESANLEKTALGVMHGGQPK